jgi:uncharacterized protein (TIGR02266 family)
MGAVVTQGLVFVVDDSPTQRLGVCSQLKALGWEAVALDGGQACLAALAAGRTPQAILMDLHMPDMKGDAACQRVKENPAWRDVPVIMFTTANSPHEMMYCWRAGADDFLSKPAQPAELAAKLAAVADAPLPVALAPRHGRLVMVEDSRFYRTLVGGALEHEGFEVTYAPDAASARRLLEDGATDADGFLLDVLLPDGSGVQLAEALRRSPRFALKRVVLLTAFAPTPEVQAQVARLPGVSLVEKRALPADLLVRRVLELLAPAHRGSLRAVERSPFFSVVSFRGPSGEALSGFSYDASPGGLFVRTLTPGPVGSQVQLEVRVASQPGALRAEGTVAWANPFRRGSSVRPPVGMGLRLTRVDEALLRQFPSPSGGAGR